MRWWLFLLLIASHSALAESYKHLKTAEWESLATITFVGGDCPFTQNDIEEDVLGELLRARLKKVETHEIFLSVSIKCVSVIDKVTHAGYAMSVNIHFGVFITRNGEDVPAEFVWPDQGGVAIYGKDTSNFRVGFRELVNKALTDYLESNFRQ